MRALAILKGKMWLQRFLGDERRFLAVLVFVSLAVRIAAACLTYGTEDVDSWKIVSEVLAQGKNPYEHTHFLRWPPLWMGVIFGVQHLADSLNWSFTTLIKIPPVVADAAIAIVLYYYFKSRQEIHRARLSSILYAINPISILIVAVHGQFDSITVLFLLWSLYFMERHTDESDVYVAAILLGLAIFSKTWPLLLLPLFISRISGFRAKVVFLGIALIPFVVSLSTLYVLTPDHIYRKVVRYGGIAGWWGIPSLPNVIRHPVTNRIAELYAKVGRYLLLLAMGALALVYGRVQRRKSPSLLEALVVGISLIYLILPGYGTQYMVWILPFALIYSWTNRSARYLLIIIALELIIEYAFRPYNGMLGGWVIKPPSLRPKRFYADYGSSRDLALTNILRWPLWLYFGWFLTKILASWRPLVITSERTGD